MFNNKKFYLTVLTVLFMTVMFAGPAFAHSVNLTISPAGESNAGEDIVFSATAVGFSNPEYQFGYRRVGGSWTLRNPGTSSTYTRSIPADFSGGEFQLGVRVREAGGSWKAMQGVPHTINPVEPSVTLTVREQATGRPAGDSRVGNLLTVQASSENVNNPEYRFGWRYDGGSWNKTSGRSTARVSYTPTEPYTGDMDFAVQVREAGGDWLDTDRVSHTVIDCGRSSPDGFYANFGYDTTPKTNHRPWRWSPSDRWQSGEASRYTDGRVGEWHSGTEPGSTYRNFEYTVVMGRAFDSFSAQYIVIRAGDKFDDDYRWYPGYFFGYANTGNYTIGIRYPDGSEKFTNWMPTPAIKKYEINELRVRAVGDSMWFYINDHLVHKVTDSTYKIGRVGVTAYYSEQASRSRFLVYGARLERLSRSASLQDLETVSPEQEALNRKASENLNDEAFLMEGDFNY